MAFKTFGLLLLEKLATTGSAPDTRCSLLDLCGVWSGQAQSQTTGRDACRATAIWRQLLEIKFNFVSIKGGRVTYSSICARLLWHLRFPRADLFPSSPPPSRACTQPSSRMDFDLAEKIDRKRRRALRTPDDDMSLTQGYLRDVL